MIGFFEHQYLSFKKNHIRTLLALARVDEDMHEKEVELLYKIGQKYGLKDWQVKKIIDSKEKYELNVPDNYNDRMNLLYDLIQMVFADEVVEKREIEFCEDIAKNFGLKKEVVKWLIGIFEKNPELTPEEWGEVKRDAEETYVKSKK